MNETPYEIRTDSQIARLMRMAVEDGGPDRAALLVQRGDTLYVEVLASTEGVMFLLHPEPLEKTRKLPSGLVERAARTRKEALLIEPTDATGQDALACDRSTPSPKSALCLPLLQGGALTGALYIEHTLVASAFTVERRERLSALAADLALSIEAPREAATGEHGASRAKKPRDAEAHGSQVAGSFAHEMRNALTGARLMLFKVWRAQSDAPLFSLCAESSAALQELYVQLRDRMVAEDLARVAATFRQVNKNEQQVDEVLSGIDHALDRALAITRMVLEYARLNQEQPGNALIEIRSLVEVIICELQTDFSANSIVVETDIAPSCTLIGNAVHFDSILRNLMQNARDALVDTDGENPRLIRVEATTTSEHVVLRVLDTGVGIPAEHRGRIFDAFFSTKPSTGTGLGLRTVRQLVTLYGGTIAMDSEVKRGTRFELTFPSARDGGGGRGPT